MSSSQHRESPSEGVSAWHRPSAISGEMATLFRKFDWASTPIGPPAGWPESWRNAVRIILDSSFPTALAFGSELIYFYNDAFIPVGGPARHPAALGLPVPLAWREIWTQILEPRFSITLGTGEPTGEEDLLIPLQRSGYLEETYITFSFAALRDDRDLPNGIFCTAYETTARVIADRQLNCLRALAAQSACAETPEGACQAAATTLERHPRDLPFALLYLVEGTQAHLCGTSGLVSIPASVAQTIDLTAGTDAWRVPSVVGNGKAVLVDGAQALIGECIRTPEVTPEYAFALPISGRGGERPTGVLIAGANPMRPLQESRAFHELIASQLETSISNARAKQHERERVRALADLDRAKTLFFSNISHELRTPLTLLLGPLNDVLAAGALLPTHRELLQIAQRGARRLLKLVNSLLEFSRIEAGRIEAAYEPVDLALITSDLASVFRSAFERAGVALEIDCSPLPEPVFVDGDMWEKIVLNLLSNAFKFTLHGRVSVRLRAGAEHVELQIEDSGCGVAVEDLPRLFNRFFRGRAAEARTHEGSGIGLSLVQELVKLHGGTVEARSVLGQGTTFTVRLPRGCQHLAPERIGASRKLPRADTGALPFVEEALGWLPSSSSGAQTPRAAARIERDSREESESVSGCARILVVDDNADMRDYLGRLLGAQWHVDAAPDSSIALQQIARNLPDLVIADVMMPGIDGFGLLRLLRETPRTSGVPVMLLSARAGEEASEEALRAGADDYVIKPFSARELLARVDARLAQAKLRLAERRSREAAERANRARDDFFATLSHELRSPLMAILGWTTVLKKAGSEQEGRTAVELIERNARVQRRLIDDLLDMAQIVTGRMRVELQPLPSLSEVMRVVIDSCMPVAAAKEVSLCSSLEPDTGPLEGDPERLQQVLWNLLSNAIRFTPRHGRIEVRCVRHQHEVELAVIDSGRGIRAEAVPHLFERYWQGQFDSHPGQGLGLGLAIAHRIVSLHSGTISAQSAGEGHGATFTVRLPVSKLVPISASPPSVCLGARIAEAATLVDASEALVPDTLESIAPDLVRATAPDTLHILLIDDHEGIAKACQRLLASYGHTVVRAAGLTGALRALERTGRRFDVVICDLTLPDGDGLELPRRMDAGASRSAGAAAPDVPPAIAISGRVFEDDVARSLAAGFQEHLTKPFDAEELLAAVRRVTQGERAAGAGVDDSAPRSAESA
jgi:signal transduction histidine kinase